MLTEHTVIITQFSASPRHDEQQSPEDAADTQTESQSEHNQPAQRRHDHRRSRVSPPCTFPPPIHKGHRLFIRPMAPVRESPSVFFTAIQPSAPLALSNLAEPPPPPMCSRCLHIRFRLCPNAYTRRFGDLWPARMRKHSEHFTTATRR